MKWVVAVGLLASAAAAFSSWWWMFRPFFMAIFEADRLKQEAEE